MAKRYYWLKLKEDFFRDKRIKKLRKIAGGDTYTVIYLKMLLKTLNTDGVLQYEGIEDSFAEELALDLDEDPDNVEITLNFLISSGLMVELPDNQFALTEVAENVGSETSSAQRVREHRERQKALQCNTDVTGVKHLCNVEREREKEKEKEERREEKRIDYQQIADMYNDTCVSFPRLVSLSDVRKKAIKARLNKYTLDDFKKVFEKAEASDFLKGANDRNWSATFDWMLKDANFAKILEGNYDNRKSKAPKNAGTRNPAAELEEFYKMAEEWADKE